MPVLVAGCEWFRKAMVTRAICGRMTPSLMKGSTPNKKDSHSILHEFPYREFIISSMETTYCGKGDLRPEF